jgi:hypothetical protein
MRSFFRVFRVLPWLFFTPDAQLSTIRLTIDSQRSQANTP